MLLGKVYILLKLGKVYINPKIQEFLLKASYSWGRVLLNNKLSLAQFKQRTKALRTRVDNIAGHKYHGNDNDFVEARDVKQSNTIVYNRIDKAGSTTLISNINIKG